MSSTPPTYLVRVIVRVRVRVRVRVKVRVRVRLSNPNRNRNPNPGPPNANPNDVPSEVERRVQCESASEQREAREDGQAREARAHLPG